jgi:hypothetical protein
MVQASLSKKQARPYLKNNQSKKGWRHGLPVRTKLSVGSYFSFVIGRF